MTLCGPEEPHEDATALEEVAALYDYEASREWVAASGAGRWFGDLPDNDYRW